MSVLQVTTRHTGSRKRGKRKVVIVFDEVQQMLEYESDVVERRLRSMIQKHKDVSCIFLVSISPNVA